MVEEHIFTLKSLIARKRMQGKEVVLQMFDLEKFFDKEMMQDALITCQTRDADAKAIRCWYNLNKDTQIRVRTGVGMSEPGEVGAVIGQGTIGGALVSQAVLDDALTEHFQPGGEEELNYGTVDMAPLLFQDDFIHVSDKIMKARSTNRKINQMIKERGLCLNRKKSVCLVIASKKQKLNMLAELKANPLMCGTIETKEVESDKWLGQIISANGLADSVVKTIENREAKIKGACLEIVDIIQDWRAQVVGGIDSALQMWEACCIPSLLTGAGTWVNITPAAERRLEALQHWFLRLVLRVGPGCPTPSLRWETGVLSMRMRVWVEKLMMVQHLRNLDTSALARNIYDEQKEKNWPGLVKETKQICLQLNIPDCNDDNISKWGVKGYRKYIIQKCKEKDEKDLMKMAEGKTKCAKIMTEKYGKKAYMTENILSKVRKIFHTRVKMHLFASNYPKDNRFYKTDWTCRCGTNKESESHLMNEVCLAYEDLRLKYTNLEDDDQRTSFFSDVLERRGRLEEGERRTQDTLVAGNTTDSS